jgi:hypothetical protein
LNVPQSLFKNLKILDLENTLVVEIQKGILLYSCLIVRKFYLIVLSVIVYVLRQNCRAAGWWRVKASFTLELVLKLASEINAEISTFSSIHNEKLSEKISGI